MARRQRGKTEVFDRRPMSYGICRYICGGQRAAFMIEGVRARAARGEFGGGRWQGLVRNSATEVPADRSLRIWR